VADDRRGRPPSLPIGRSIGTARIRKPPVLLCGADSLSGVALVRFTGGTRFTGGNGKCPRCLDPDATVPSAGGENAMGIWRRHVADWTL
jgi:hypothetical protein